MPIKRKLPYKIRMSTPQPIRRTILVSILVALFLFTACSSGTSGTPTPEVTRPAGTAPAGVGGGTPSSPSSADVQKLLQTEQLLLMTPHPLRDLYSLAQRFKLHTSTPIPHVGRTTPINGHVGQEDSFWVNNQDTSMYTRIFAKLVYITPHVYMYVQDGQTVNLAALQSSADTFESKNYPTDRSTYGSEWTPGIDDDVHLTILNAIGLGKGVGGYFSSEDEYPTSVNTYSNEREMFYVSLDGPSPGTVDYNSTLSHEFQHMIHWYQHPVDLSWTNEGMSVLAQHINGYSTDGLDVSFLQTPDTQLNDWSGDISQDAVHYGAGYLFMDYFAEHYGGYSVLKELLQDPASPPTNFDHVLAHHGYSDRFEDVLHKWFIANFVQDTTVYQGAYGYPSIQGLALTPQHSINSYPLLQSDSVHQYAAEYYNLQPTGNSGTLTVGLTGSPTVHIIDNSPLGATNEWWSNRYDNMDSTLTRSFDLSSLKGKQATLQFATWFDLERGYDYAFVEASTDGINWTTLKGTYTTTNNSSGANLGNGSTGVSGGGSSPQWVQESMDLTPYAGKTVRLRFEEVTDDAVNMQGFALDDIRIPELGFQDTLNSDNGWVSNGFIRSDNILPEHYTMQALVYKGQQFTVSEGTMDLATGQGSITIPNFGAGVTRVVLIISALAPETTLLAQYQLDLRVT